MIVEYAGGMRFVARHRGLEAVSDQPEDGGGGNAAMTPTELFVASLGMCVAVYVVGYAKRHGIPVEGLTVEMDYQIAEAPRRVGRMAVKVKLPHPIGEDQRTVLQRVADQCLVHNTLTHPPEVAISLA